MLLTVAAGTPNDEMIPVRIEHESLASIVGQKLVCVDDERLSSTRDSLSQVLCIFLCALSDTTACSLAKPEFVCPYSTDTVASAQRWCRCIMSQTAHFESILWPDPNLYLIMLSAYTDPRYEAYLIQSDARASVN